MKTQDEIVAAFHLIIKEAKDSGLCVIVGVINQDNQTNSIAWTGNYPHIYALHAIIGREIYDNVEIK
jgi:hypothetical protein